MHFLSTAVPPEVLLTIGPLTLHSYAVFVTSGALAGLLFFWWLAREKGLAKERILDCALLLLVFGFIGARLYHVLNEPAYYAAHPGEIVAVWNGGMAIHGGILAGVAALWWYARRKGLSFLMLLDTVAPGLLLGQAIGRWGNYFNQELFGGPTDLPWKLLVAPAHRPAGYEAFSYFHPTFLYESLGLLIIVMTLFIFRTYFRTPGIVAFAALAASQALRFSTELLRIDRTPLIAGLRLPALVSLLLFLFALSMLYLLYRHATPRANRP